MKPLQPAGSMPPRAFEKSESARVMRGAFSRYTMMNRSGPLGTGDKIAGATARRAASRTLSICALAGILCAPMFALDPNRPLGQLYHSSWNARNGLNGSVMALAQTTDGYLWVGTTDGLFRFDGLSFERYEPLPATSVSALMAVPDGGIWIGFRSGGVSYLKNGQATNYTER